MKKVLILLITLVGIVSLVGCSKKEEENNSLDKIIAKNNYVIVDVRTKEEYNESHIKEAINIPYDQIDKNTDLDKTKTILVYCKSGARSNKAYNTLKDLGYDVLDLGAFDSIELDKE